MVFDVFLRVDGRLLVAVAIGIGACAIAATVDKMLEESNTNEPEEVPVING